MTFLFSIFMGAAALVAPFLIDQYTKAVALEALTAASQKLFPWCEFVLTFNYGVSWSLFAARTQLEFYFLVSLIAIVLLFFARYTMQRVVAGHSVYAELMLISAALSNMYDRFTIGAVIDFIHLHYAGYSFPVFNLADVFIFCCAVVIFIKSFWD